MIIARHLPHSILNTMINKADIPPTIFTIFGGTGDLSRKKLLPALFDLFAKGYLPRAFEIVSYSRRSLSNADYRVFVQEAIKEKGHHHDRVLVERFLAHVRHVAGDFSVPDDYNSLQKEFKKIDTDIGQCTSKVIYLAVPPQYYQVIAEHVHNSQIGKECDSSGRFVRILVEKPFGSDLQTAQALDERLSSLFDESQLYRIDHYLAKEVVENLLTFRFSNALFEPLWHKEYIEEIRVVMHEEFGVGDRGSFYDGVGALRDVGQNHLLQMLALVAMERPVDMSASSIRGARADLLSKLRLVTEGKDQPVRGQYRGYRTHKGVDLHSDTETFFRLTGYIDDSRWKGVPVVLEAGKRMGHTHTTIEVRFKHPETCLCTSAHQENRIRFRIQPNEGISVTFLAKVPGFTDHIESKDLSFNYASSREFSMIPDAYERVLFDCIRANQTLFTTAAEVSAAWQAITPVLDAWKSLPLVEYDPGVSSVRS